MYLLGSSDKVGGHFENGGHLGKNIFGPISRYVHKVENCNWAKFHAFHQNWTMVSPPLKHYTKDNIGYRIPN